MQSKHRCAKRRQKKKKKQQRHATHKTPRISLPRLFALCCPVFCCCRSFLRLRLLAPSRLCWFVPVCAGLRLLRVWNSFFGHPPAQTNRQKQSPLCFCLSVCLFYTSYNQTTNRKRKSGHSSMPFLLGFFENNLGPTRKNKKRDTNQTNKNKNKKK